jgi:hypothetical protein
VFGTRCTVEHRDAQERDRSGFLEVPGRRLHAAGPSRGRGPVFIHDPFLDTRMWDDLWSAFAECYPVVRLDLHEFGNRPIRRCPSAT